MIKMLVAVAGKDYSIAPGEIVPPGVMDKAEQQRYVDSGQAETVKAEKKAKSKK